MTQKPSEVYAEELYKKKGFDFGQLETDEKIELAGKLGLEGTSDEAVEMLINIESRSEIMFHLFNYMSTGDTEQRELMIDAFMGAVSNYLEKRIDKCLEDAGQRIKDAEIENLAEL